MDTSSSWTLKRFARYVPVSKENSEIPWKVYEAKKSAILLTIVDSGYFLVMRGQESLDTVHLVSSRDSIKVQQKSDNLVFRFTLKGASRMIRMQFDGQTREEALKECSSALKKLMEYLPVTALEEAPLPPNQTHTEIAAPVIQPGNDVGHEPEPVQGKLPLKKLVEHCLGDTVLSLPQLYHHSHLAEGDLEPILRVFLLDPSFHAFVENVETELKKLLQK